ncbi:iron-siderophore ABC transporter substrate-binding protein [soil metagenome]
MSQDIRGLFERSISRRHAIAIAGAGALLGTRVVSAGAQATPEASFDLGLTPGVIPTIFGDITIEGTPERIVTLTDGALDAVISIGLRPTGATWSSNGESAAEYLVHSVADDLTYVGGGGELDMEAVVALKPDIILSDRYLMEDQYDSLSKVAPVICPNEIEVSGADALQQWEYEQLVWGHALGRGDDAVTAITALRAAAAAAQSGLSEHVGESVVVFRPQVDGPIIMSHNWITGVILTWAGFRGTAFTEEMPPPHGGQGSFEQMAEIDADWLFLAARNQEMRDEVENYEAKPVYQELSAVQSGQAVLVSGDLWSGATGVQAGYAMLADIERIIGGGTATPTA